MRLLLLVLMACFVMSSASARTQFTVYGTMGDAGATDECEPGWYFTGIVGNVGAWIDQITVVCSQLKPDGTLTGSKSKPSRGGTGGGFLSVLCDKNEVITSISMDRTRNYTITRVSFTCTNVKTLKGSQKEFRPPSITYAGTSPPHTCPRTELATGMVIRYGKYVNGLALICNTYTPPVTTSGAPIKVPVPVTPPPPTTTPPVAAPAEKFVEVVRSVDIYSAPGGDAKNKTGKSLSAGTQKVKLIERKSPWFHLEWPTGNGWVYSAPDYTSLKLP